MNNMIYLNMNLISLSFHMSSMEELLKALKTDDSSTVSRLVSYSISINELVF